MHTSLRSDPLTLSLSPMTNTSLSGGSPFQNLSYCGERNKRDDYALIFTTGKLFTQLLTFSATFQTAVKLGEGANLETRDLQVNSTACYS